MSFFNGKDKKLLNKIKETASQDVEYCKKRIEFYQNLCDKDCHCESSCVLASGLCVYFDLHKNMIIVYIDGHKRRDIFRQIPENRIIDFEQINMIINEKTVVRYYSASMKKINSVDLSLQAYDFMIQMYPQKAKKNHSDD